MKNKAMILAAVLGAAAALHAEGFALRVEGLYSPGQNVQADRTTAFPGIYGYVGSLKTTEHDVVTSYSRGLNLDLFFPVSDMVTFELGAKYFKQVERHNMMSQRTTTDPIPAAYGPITQEAATVWGTEVDFYTIRVATTFYFYGAKRQAF